MSLASKLRRWRPARTGKEQPTPHAAASTTPEATTHALPDPSGDDTVAYTPEGVMYFETVWPLSTMYGPFTVDAFLEVPPAGWQAWLPGLPFDPATTVVIDTETTGLTRGAGTYAFLIGMGYFTDDGFLLRQYVMRDYDEEPAMIQAVISELEKARSVVTFNGKSFDWPLLQTRATMNRLRLPHRVHLDVLHPARRLWRHTTPGCSLKQLERHVLGLCRVNDPDGADIPQLFFDFVLTGDMQPLMQVVGHNRLDILSLLTLATYIGHVATPTPPATPPLSGGEALGMGRLFMDIQEKGMPRHPEKATTGAAPSAPLPAPQCWRRAVDYFQLALQQPLSERLRAETMVQLAAVYRRSGEIPKAVDLWERMVHMPPVSFYAHIELAKHYEHRVKNFPKAREHTIAAIDNVRKRQRIVGATSRLETDLADARHRLQRLESREARQRLAAASAERASRSSTGTTPPAGAVYTKGNAYD